MRLWLLLGVGLVIAGLSAAVYVQQQRVLAARAATVVAERDRDTWRSNAATAADAAAASEKAVADLKKQLAESAQRADDLERSRVAAERAYGATLAKVKEQHAPGESSGYMRALLDELCRQDTTTACVY